METERIDHTKICAIAQHTDVELELERLVALANTVPELKVEVERLEDKIDALEKTLGRREEQDGFCEQLMKNISFRNGTMILEHARLE